MVKKDRRKNKRNKQSSLNKQNSVTKSNYSQKQFSSERIDYDQPPQEKLQLSQFDTNLKEPQTQQIRVINVQTQENAKQVKTENEEEVKASQGQQQATKNLYLTDEILQETGYHLREENNYLKLNQVENIGGQKIAELIIQESQIKIGQNQTEQVKTPCEDSQSREYLQVLTFQANDPDQIPQLSEQYPQVRTVSDNIKSVSDNTRLGEFMPVDQLTLQQKQQSQQLHSSHPPQQLKQQQQSNDHVPVSQSSQFQLCKNIMDQTQLPKMQMQIGQSGVAVHDMVHNDSDRYQNSVQQQASKEERLILQAYELVSPKIKPNNHQQYTTEPNPLEDAQSAMPKINSNNNQLIEYTNQNDQLIFDLSMPIEIPSPKKEEEHQIQTVQPLQCQTLQPQENYTLQSLQPYAIQPFQLHKQSIESQCKMQRIKMFFERNSKIVQEIQLDSEDQQMSKEVNNNQHQLHILGGDSNQCSSRQGSDFQDERQLLESCKESIIERLREQIDQDNKRQGQLDEQQPPPTSSPVLLKVRAVKQYPQRQQQVQSNWQQYQSVQSPPISLQSLSQQSLPTLVFSNMLNPSHRSDDDMHDPTNSPVEHSTHRPYVHHTQQCTVVGGNEHQTLVHKQQHLPIYLQNSIINLTSSLTLQNTQPIYYHHQLQSSSHQIHSIQLSRNEEGQLCRNEEIKLSRNQQTKPCRNAQETKSYHLQSSQQQQFRSQSSQLKQSIDFRLQLQIAYQSKHGHQFTSNNPSYAPSLYESLPIQRKCSQQEIDSLKDQKSLQYIPIPSQMVTKQNLQRHTKQMDDQIITAQLGDNQQGLTLIDAEQHVVAPLTSSPQPNNREQQYVVQSVVKRWECPNNKSEFSQLSQLTQQNESCKQDSSAQFQLIKQSIEEGFFHVNGFEDMSPQTKDFHNRQQDQYWDESGRDTIINVLTEQMQQLEQSKHNIISQQRVSQFTFEQQNTQQYNEGHYQTQRQQQQSQIQQSRHVHFGSNAPILHHYSDEQYSQGWDASVSKPSQRYRQFMADHSAHNQVQQSRITIGNHVDFSHEESHIRYTGYPLAQCQSFIDDIMYISNNLLQKKQKEANLTQVNTLYQLPKEQMLILNIEFHSAEVMQPETQEIIWKALDETQLPRSDPKHCLLENKQQLIQYPSLLQYSSSQRQKYSLHLQQLPFPKINEINTTQPNNAQPISHDKFIPHSPPSTEGLVLPLADQVYRPSSPRVVSLDQFKKKYQVRTITLAQHKNCNKNQDGFITLKPTQSRFIYNQQDMTATKNITQQNTIKTTQHPNLTQQLSNELTQPKKPQVIQQSRIDINIDQTTINREQYSNTFPQLQNSTEVIQESHATLSLSQSTQQTAKQIMEEQIEQQPASPIIMVNQSQPLPCQPIITSFSKNSILQQLHNEENTIIIAPHTLFQTPYPPTNNITKEQEQQLLPLTVDILQKDFPQLEIDMLPMDIPLQQIIYKQNKVLNQQNKENHKQQHAVNENQLADLLFSTNNDQTIQKERQQTQQKARIQNKITQLPVSAEEKPIINRIPQNLQQKSVEQFSPQNTVSFNVSTPTDNSSCYLDKQRNHEFFTSYSTMNKHYNPPIPFRDIRLSPTIILPSQKSPKKSERSSNNIPVEIQSRSKQKLQPNNKFIAVFNRPIQIPQLRGTNDSDYSQPKLTGQQGQSPKHQSIYQVSNKPSNQYSFNYPTKNQQQAKKYVFNITPKTSQNKITNLTSSKQKLGTPSQYFQSILKPNAQSRYIIQQPSSYSKEFYQTGPRTNQSRKKQFDLREQTFRKYSQIQSKKTPVTFKIQLQNSKSKDKSFFNNQTILHHNLETTSRQNKHKKQKICLTLRRDYLDKTHTINQSKEKSSTKNQIGPQERRNTSTSQCRKLNGGSIKKKISFQTEGNQTKGVKKIKQVRLNREQKGVGITEPSRQNQYEQRKFQKIQKFNPGEVKVKNEKVMNKTRQSRSNSSKGFKLINKNPVKPIGKLLSSSQNFGKQQPKIKLDKVEEPSDKDNRKSPSLRVIGKKTEQPINMQQQAQSNQPFWEQFKGIIKNRLIGNSSPKTNSQQRRTQYGKYQKDQLSDVENQNIIFKY